MSDNAHTATSPTHVLLTLAEYRSLKPGLGKLDESHLTSSIPVSVLR